MSDDELKQLFEASEANMRRHMDVVAVGLRADFDGLRRHFDVFAERVDKRFDLLTETVLLLDEKLDRNVASIREDMRHGFADTHALISFSYTNLDRRVSALERRRRR